MMGDQEPAAASLIKPMQPIAGYVPRNLQRPFCLLSKNTPALETVPEDKHRQPPSNLICIKYGFSRFRV